MCERNNKRPIKGMKREMKRDNTVNDRKSADSGSYF